MGGIDTHLLLQSAYLNFEPEDVELVELGEAYLMERYGRQKLLDLGPAPTTALLAIASLWHSLPANSPAEDYVVNYHSLCLACHSILISAYRPKPSFPYTHQELYQAVQSRRRQAYFGDSSALAEMMKTAIQAVDELKCG